MNDALKPSWVKRWKPQNLTDEVTTLKIELGWPEFWRQLYLEIGVNIEALPEIGGRGRVSSFGDPEIEVRYRVDVSRKGGNLGTTYTDLFCRPGDSMIRSLTLEGESENFTFCVLPNNKEIGVMSDDGLSPLTAKRMAEMLVEQAMNRACEVAF